MIPTTKPELTNENIELVNENIQLVEQAIQEAKSYYDFDYECISHYLEIPLDSRINWRNTAVENNKLATYKLGIIEKDLVIYGAASPRVDMFTDNKNLIHVDTKSGGLENRPTGTTDKEFRKYYLANTHIQALTHLLEMVKSGELMQTTITATTGSAKPKRKYKDLKTILLELDSCFRKEPTTNVFRYYINQLKLAGKTESKEIILNQWLTYNDTLETDDNFKTLKNVTHLPYNNPLHLKKPTNKEKRLVDRVFDVYFNQTDRDYLYNWLGAALMNVPLNEIGRMLIIHGEPGVGKSRFMNKIILDVLFPNYHQKVMNFAGMFTNGERFGTIALKNRRITFFDEASWCAPKNPTHTRNFEGLNVPGLKSLIMDGFLQTEEKNGAMDTEYNLTSLLIASTNEVPVVDNTDNMEALGRRLLLLTMKETSGYEKAEALNMDDTALAAYVKKHIDAFTTVFISEYLKDKNKISQAPDYNNVLNIAILPKALDTVLRDLQEQGVNVDAYKRKIINVLDGSEKSYLAKSDHLYLYLNVQKNYLTDFTVQERTLVYKTFKEKFENVTNPVKYVKSSGPIKVRSVRIPL